MFVLEKDKLLYNTVTILWTIILTFGRCTIYHMELFLPVFVRKRDTEQILYFSAYPERWANSLGEWVTKDTSIGEPV